MELLVILFLATQQSLTGAELIQYCRSERAEALAITGDENYAYSVYMECLENG